jgi:hypothetical protein
VDDENRNSFILAEDFQAAAPTGGVGLGLLETQYQELFSEVIEDGVITHDERERLLRAAENLGLAGSKLSRLEQAMTAAYETHHRVRILDRSRDGSSFRPLAPPPAPSITAIAPANDPGEVPRLREENLQLRQRIAALEEELARAQAAVNVEVDLGGLEAAVAHTENPEDAWKRVRRDPLDPAGYRALYDAYDAAGSVDGKVLCAQALAFLDAATPEQATLAARHRQRELPSPHSAIDASLWHAALVHPEEDQVTGSIFGVVAGAILVGRVTTLRRDGLLRVVGESQRLQPARSTVMAARAVAWASAMLGLPEPVVAVDKEEPGGYLHVAGVPPLTVLGRAVLSGLGAPELAFHVGRHLAGYRAEHFVKTLFSATEDLEDLFLAALLVAQPRLPLSGAPRARVEPLARAIEPLLEPPQLDALRGHYLRFAEEGGRTNLQRWSLAADKTAARAGLALCQDLPSALVALEAEEGRAGPLGLDLLAYFTSDRFLRLRRSLGLAVLDA